MSFIALVGKDLIIINKQTQSFSCPSKPSLRSPLHLIYIISIALLHYQHSHIVSLAYPYDIISIALFVVLPLNV